MLGRPNFDFRWVAWTSASESYFSLTNSALSVLVLNFKLEEGIAALLLLLPVLVAGGCFFYSASGLGCRLVVETSQAIYRR